MQGGDDGAWLPAVVRCAGVRLGAGWTGGERGFPQFGAALRQRASLPGDRLFFGAVYEVEESDGSLDLRLGPDESGKG